MYNIYYDKNNRDLNLKINNSTHIIESTSAPVVSPNKKSLAFITPYEWECKGEIKVIDLQSGMSRKIELNLRKDLTPKFLVWKDVNNIFMIIGYRWGTVAVGGDLYSLDLTSNTLTLLKEFEERIQIKEIRVFNQKNISLHGIKYSDNTFNEFDAYSIKYKI